jgi:ribose transport system permease protein
MNKQNDIATIDNSENNLFFGKLTTIIKSYLVMFAIIVLVLVTIIVEPKFLSVLNASNIINQLGGLSMVALGMTIAIIGGYIDLSVVGTINLVAIVTIMLINPLGQVPALIIGICLGAILGFLNGLIILSGGATSMFTALFITYAMSAVYNALAMIISNGQTIQMFFIESNTSIFDTIGSGSIGIVSLPFIVFIAALIVLNVFQKKTLVGRAVELSGGNKKAARLAGISLKKTTLLIFTISGFMSGLTAIVLFTRITKANPTIGNGYDMQAVLAVVVGGTTLAGGKGSVIRTFLGLLLITLLSTCMDLLGVSPFVKTLLTGAVLILAIWLDNRKEIRGEYK